ncbi:MAG: Spy/CpxP family protein refolding chaperone [Candidatus Competibacteraceae bacterium]|nr:Spy/CpxP family protein refolding chaperone [Candidatus Competibacteraceae bacterium]
MTAFWGGRADAHSRWAAADDAGSHFHHGWGNGHGWHGRRGWPVCNGQRLERAERMLAQVRDSLELTAQQEPAWSALNDAVYAGGEMITTACEQWSQDSQTPPERLERVETMLATGLDAVRQVRLPFEEFYAVLTDAQRATLDDLIRHRH